MLTISLVQCIISTTTCLIKFTSCVSSNLSIYNSFSWYLHVNVHVTFCKPKQFPCMLTHQSALWIQQITRNIYNFVCVHLYPIPESKLCFLQWVYHLCNGYTYCLYELNLLHKNVDLVTWLKKWCPNFGWVGG